MGSRARISTQQLTCLTGIFSHIAFVLYMPSTLTGLAGRDAWLAVPLGILLGFIPVALLLSLLARHHPRRSFAEMAESALGKWLGKACTLVYAGFALFLCSLVLRNVMDFSGVALLPETPILMTGSTLTLCLIYLVYNGAEVIVRLGTLIMGVIAIVVLLLPLPLLPEMEWLRIRPAFEFGFPGIFSAAWTTAGWFGEVWVLGAFAGLLDRPERMFRSLVWGGMVATANLLIVVGSTLLLFGPELTARYTFPSYAMVQQIQVGEFMSRVEVALITIWLSGMLVKAAVSLWAATSSAAAMLGLKHDRKHIIPMAATALGLTLVWPSSTHLAWFGSHWYTPIFFPIQVSIPAIMLAASWVKARLKKAAPA